MEGLEGFAGLERDTNQARVDAKNDIFLALLAFCTVGVGKYWDSAADTYIVKGGLLAVCARGRTIRYIAAYYADRASRCSIP
jgi:hypothetical protein